jgi:rubrerythrin
MSNFINSNNNNGTIVKNPKPFAPNQKNDGKVRTNLDVATNSERTCVGSIMNNETQRAGILYPETEARSGSSNRVESYHSASDNNVAHGNDVEKPALYRCSVCGVIQEGGENPPRSCPKCDNEKFYRLK